MVLRPRLQSACQVSPPLSKPSACFFLLLSWSGGLPDVTPKMEVSGLLVKYHPSGITAFQGPWLPLLALSLASLLFFFTASLL